MEHLFSLEEDIPKPFPFLTPLSSPLRPQAISGGLGGEGIDVGGNVGGGGAMIQCPSEWCFQNFMDKSSLVDTSTPPPANPNTYSDLYNNPGAEASWKRRYEVRPQEDNNVVEVIPVPPAPSPPSAALDPMAYNAMLRQKLDAELAAAAMRRTSCVIRRQCSHDNRGSQNSSGSIKLGSQNHTGDTGAHQLSSSSWDPSRTDEDMEGGAEKMGNRNVTSSKVKKRKESNRDSARRSRNKKAAHIKELQEQVSFLRAENNSLMKRLAEVSQRCTNVSIDNRVLKANVATLETKVKMSETTLKSLTCVRSFPQAISSISSLSHPLSGSPLHTMSNALLPTQDVSYLSTTTTNVGVRNRYIPKLPPTPTSQIHNPSNLLHMQPVVTLDHHQIRTSGGMPSASMPNPQCEDTMMDQNEFGNMGMQ